jgi:hypothetical protein
VFPKDEGSGEGDPTLGRTGPAGRPAGLPKAPRRGSSLSAPSFGCFNSWSKDPRKAVSTASLVKGSLAISGASGVEDWAGVGDRVGVGVSSFDCFFACSSSLGSHTGTTGSVALWMLKPVPGNILVKTQTSARPTTTAAAAGSVRLGKPIATDLIPFPLPTVFGKRLVNRYLNVRLLAS